MKTNKKVVTVRLHKTGDRWLITEPFGPQSGASADVQAPAGKKNSGLQCQALTERMQLGEVLSEEERAFLKDKCH